MSCSRLRLITLGTRCFFRSCGWFVSPSRGSQWRLDRNQKPRMKSLWDATQGRGLVTRSKARLHHLRPQVEFHVSSVNAHLVATCRLWTTLLFVIRERWVTQEERQRLGKQKSHRSTFVDWIKSPLPAVNGCENARVLCLTRTGKLCASNLQSFSRILLRQLYL